MQSQQKRGDSNGVSRRFRAGSMHMVLVTEGDRAYSVTIVHNTG